MDLLASLARFADSLDPGVADFLEHFRDARVPLELSFTILAAGLAILLLMTSWGAVAWVRIGHLRRCLTRSTADADADTRLGHIDAVLRRSLFAAAWREYRPCLRVSDGEILYPRRPAEHFGLYAVAARSFPARFFAATHGYFVGVGLLLTFIGLVAALKFSAAGVASPDLATAKLALTALLSAASFKFMTSIAGLGCSLVLSLAARLTTCAVEGAGSGLAGDLESLMTPIVAESLAFEQLALTRAQLGELTRLQASAPATDAPAQGDESLKRILAAFLAELRGAAGGEMKQLTGRLSEVGAAIGQMQQHVGRSGDRFAEQLELAASRLAGAASRLEASVDRRVEKTTERLDAFSQSLAANASHAAHSMTAAAEGVAQRLGTALGGVDHLHAGMREIVTSLDGARRVLDQSAETWMRSAAPVTAAVDTTRQIAEELARAATQISSAQRDITAMAGGMTRLTEKTAAAWESYRGRFEGVDADLRKVFEELHGGTRALGAEFTAFAGKLDRSLAQGMEALSLGTEELGQVVETLVAGVKKAA